MQQKQQNKSAKRRQKRDLQKLMEEWRKEGFLLSGGTPYKYRWHKPATMTPGPSASEIVRHMRDEDWR